MKPDPAGTYPVFLKTVPATRLAAVERPGKSYFSRRNRSRYNQFASVVTFAKYRAFKPAPKATPTTGTAWPSFCLVIFSPTR